MPTLKRRSLRQRQATYYKCSHSMDNAIAMAACQAIIQDENQSGKDRASAYAYAGYAALDEGQDDIAMDYFNNAMKLAPNSDIAYAGRSAVEFKLSQWDPAIADAQKAIQLSPDTHPQAYLVLGTLADRNGDHEARIAYMSKAIGILPTYAEAYAGRGHGYMCEKKYDQALADFNKAVSLKPAFAAVLKPNFTIVYIERASDFMQLGHYLKGIEDLTKALQLEPQNQKGVG